ncbi:MAG: 6-bladed beta-propeller [Acidobacteriota bacterium]|nr:6-bladed beta-propeller [Acidobacteriota bacterium]
MRSVHSLRPAGLLLGMMMAVISCSEKEDSQAGEWKGATRIENGVQIVVNPKEPMYGPEAVRLIYEMEFGVSEGDENEMLGGISAFAVDPSENAYIYDGKAGQVKIFDKSGRFVGLFGRRGQGPGEFQIIDGIQINSSLEVVLHDEMKSMYFDSQGRHIKDLKAMGLGIFYGDIHHDGRGQIYALKTSPQGSVTTRELCKFAGPGADMSVLASLASSGPYKYPDVGLRYALFPDDHVIWTSPPHYEFTIVDPDGKLIKKIINTYTLRKIDDAYKSRILEMMPARFRDRINFSEHLPPLDVICPDEQSGFFVKTFEIETDSGKTFLDVYDSEGRNAARISVKMAFETSLFQKGKITIANNKLYVKDFNDEGYPVLARYLIQKNY